MQLTQNRWPGLVAGEVRAWLARRQMTGRAAAQQLGWSEIGMSRRLTGKVPFDVGELGQLAELLDIPVGVFFEAPTVPEVRKQDNRPPRPALVRAA